MTDRHKFIKKEIVRACISGDAELRRKLVKVWIEQSEKEKREIVEKYSKGFKEWARIRKLL